MLYLQKSLVCNLRIYCKHTDCIVTTETINSQPLFFFQLLHMSCYNDWSRGSAHATYSSRVQTDACT